MKSEAVLETIDTLGGTVSKEARMMFKSIVEDNKRMEERMSNIEKRMGNIESKMDNLQASMNNIIHLMEGAKNDRKERRQIFREIVCQWWFWAWFIVTTVLIFGGDISALKGLFTFGG